MAKEYEVTVIEKFSKTFTIKADTPEQALEKIKQQHENCEINLTIDDYSGVSYELESDNVSIS